MDLCKAKRSYLKMEKNYVIEYEDWDSYNAKSKEKAIEMFKKDHKSATIIEIKE